MILMMANEWRGFCSLFNGVLGGINCTETPGDRFFGWTPYVYYVGSPFWTPSGWRGKKNAWEYCFEQISDIDIHSHIGSYEDSIKPDSPVMQGVRERIWPDGSEVLITSEYYGAPQNAGTNNPEVRKKYADIVKRRIKVRPEILEAVDLFHRRTFAEKRTVGIHFRGADKPIELEGYLKSIRKPGIKQIDAYIDIAEAQKPEQIFLATDDHAAFKRATERLGSRLVATDCVRSMVPSSTTTFPVHYQYMNLGGLVAEQTLMDVLLLARCDHMVHGFSNIPSTVAYFNPDIQNTDVYA